MGRVSRTRRLSMAGRNCTRDEGGPFEASYQVLASSHCKLPSSKARVVSVAETSGQYPGWARRKFRRFKAHKIRASRFLQAQAQKEFFQPCTRNSLLVRSMASIELAMCS
jgi:hypothetical protein